MTSKAKGKPLQRRVHIVVKGKVQGVFYRANARKKAVELGLCGWVRNLADGSVEIVSEGEESAIASFINWCGRGPLWAKVDALEITDTEPSGEFVEFSVLQDG